MSFLPHKKFSWADFFFFGGEDISRYPPPPPFHPVATPLNCYSSSISSTYSTGSKISISAISKYGK